MGCRFRSRTTPMSTITTMKNASPTGAKKLIREASGPGFSRVGMSSEISSPDSSDAYRHSNS